MIKKSVFSNCAFILCFFRHIKEEWNGIYTEREIEQMIPEERAFTWFQ